MSRNQLISPALSTTPAKPFFVTGGTMPPDAASYISREADEDLFVSLKRGDLCYILNSRQMGKSSLINRTAQRLRGAGIRVAQLDLTAVGQNVRVDQWYYGLLNQLGQQLNLEDELDDFWSERESLGPMQRFFEAVAVVVLPALDSPVRSFASSGEEAVRLVIAIDEIDSVRSITAFSTDEFFAGIRECFLRRAKGQEFYRLTFCLLGTATPAELIRDARITPFNIGKRIELTDFTEAEARPMAKALVPAGTNDMEREQALLSRILHWTGGHPYLTQRVAAQVSDTPNATVGTVDQVVDRLFLAHGMRESDDNLSLVSNRLLQADCDQFALLSLYGSVLRGKRVADDETNPLHDVLKLSGVVKVVDGFLTVRNTIYRKVFDAAWVGKHLPGEELRRQQTAYRRGQFRAFGLSGAALAVVGGLAFYASTQANIARKNAAIARTEANRANAKTAEAERATYTANMNLIQAKWDENNVGRVLELLEETKNYPNKGFEWGYWNRTLYMDVVTLESGKADYPSVAFLSDEKLVVTGSNNEEAIWDITERRKINSPTLLKKTVGFPHSIFRSRTGSLNCDVRNQNEIVISDLETGKKRNVLPSKEGRVDCIAFTHDGKQIVIGVDSSSIRPDRKDTITFLDAATGKTNKTLVLEDYYYRKVTFSLAADDKSMVIYGNNNTAKIIDTQTGKELLTLKGHLNEVTCFDFSPDGKRVVTGSWDGTAKVWETQTGKELLTLKGHTKGVYSVAYSPNGKRIATGSYDGTTKIWECDMDSRLGRKLISLVSRQRTNVTIENAIFSPDGKRIAIASYNDNGGPVICDSSTGQELCTLQGIGIVLSIAFSPDGKQVAGEYQHETVVWDSLTGRKLRALKGQSFATAVNFSTDGKYIADAQLHDVRIWNVSTGKAERVLKGHTNFVQSIVYSPDGKLIVTGSDDKTARVWDSATGREILALRGHTNTVYFVTFSSDGAKVATASTDGSAKVWDTATGKELLTLKGHKAPISTVAFSPNGKRIVTASDDKTAKVWDATTGRELFSLKGHSAEVTSASYSPDGKQIITSGKDGTITIWDSDFE